MSGIRSSESGSPARARSVAWMARLVGLHGYLVAIAWSAARGGAPLASGVVALLAFAPWLLWALRIERGRRLDALAYGVVPFAWLAASAVLERLDERPSALLDVARLALGLAAHLAAVRLAEPATESPPESVVQTTNRTPLEAPTRRARLRGIAIVALLGALAASVLGAPAIRADATRPEATFAVLVASVLAITLALTVFPPMVRKERAPTVPAAKAVTIGLAWLLAAGAALLAEYLTRPAA